MIDITKSINDARKDFKIKSFPGNFFDHITGNKDYIKTNKIVLFKQDLGVDSSGFIYRTKNGNSCICINYKNSIGHQNFTLAHEIGHQYLHEGNNYDENDETLEYKNKDSIEQEANEFAAELLYPIKYVEDDLQAIEQLGLLVKGREKELADYIDDIVKRYFISFRFALFRLLFNSNYYKNGHYVVGKVNAVTEAIGFLKDIYNEEMYGYIENHKFYRPYIGTLERQVKIGKELTYKDEMSYDSMKAIIGKSGELEGFDETLI